MTGLPTNVVDGPLTFGSPVVDRPIWVLKPDPGFTFEPAVVAQVADAISKAEADGTVFWLPEGLSLYDARHGVPQSYRPLDLGPQEVRSPGPALGCSILLAAAAFGAAVLAMVFLVAQALGVI